MNAAKTREEARQRWTEIVAAVEVEKQELKKEIDELRAEKEKLNSAVKAAKTKADKIDQLEVVANQSLREATETKNSVDTSRTLVENLATKAEKLQRDSELTNAKALSNNELINDLLGKADKAALSGDFKEYANHYRLRADWYLVGVVLTVGAFIFTLLYFRLLELPSDADWSELLGFALRKIALAVPFAYVVYLLSSMQREARTLERLYRFKSAVALSLKANKELLAELYTKDNIVKVNDKPTYPIANFAQEVIMDNIYKTPEEPSRQKQESTEGQNLSFFASRHTKRALGLLKEFSEIVKNVR